METQVKERLTGAVILVALIVLLVPELLTGGPGGVAPRAAAPSGAGEPAVRTYSIDLVQGGVRQQSQAAEADLTAKALTKPPQREAGARLDPAPPPEAASADVTSVAPAAPAEEAKADETPSPAARKPAAQAVRVAKVDEKPAPQRAAREAPAEQAGSASSNASGWAVQLGSFASRDNAQRLAKQLKSKGFSAFVLAGGGSSGKLYRVRVGPQPDRAAAGAVASKLRSAGYKGGAVVSQP